MKKLYIKQQVFSFVDKFTVKDETEADRYLIEGDMIVIGGKKLHIKDMTGREVAMVQQKLLSLMPKFFVYVDENQVAEIVKKMTLFKPKYIVNGLGWEVQGDILNHDYTVRDSGGEIVRVHKVWLSWGDSYELDISDRADEKIALAVVLAIDCVLQQQQEAANASAVDNS